MKIRLFILPFFVLAGLLSQFSMSYCQERVFYNKGDIITAVGESLPYLHNYHSEATKTDKTLMDGDRFEIIEKFNSNWYKIRLLTTKEYWYIQVVGPTSDSYIVPVKSVQQVPTGLEKRLADLESRVKKLEEMLSSTSHMLSKATPPPKPSDSEVIEAVTMSLKRQVPVSWVGNLGGGRNAQIRSCTIVEKGNYNSTKNYWPMKVQCVGTCSLNDPFNQGKTVRFDRVGEFAIQQDDYGKWVATMKGGMFQ